MRKNAQSRFPDTDMMKVACIFVLCVVACLFITFPRGSPPSSERWDAIRNTNVSTLPGYGLSYIDPSCAIIGGPFRESDARDMAAKSNGGEPTDELSSLALLARAAIVSTATGDFVDVGDKADAGSTVQLRVMRSVDACGRSIWVSGALSETDAYRVRPLRAACNGTAPMLPMRISLLRIRSCEHDCVLHYLRSFGKRLVERGIVISTCYHASLDAKVAVDRYRHEIAARMPLNSIREGRIIGSSVWWQT